MNTTVEPAIEASAAMLIVVLTAFTLPTAGFARVPKGDLIVLFGSDLEGVDPYAKAGRFQETLVKNMYDYLYNCDGYNRVVPGLATGYEISGDCMTYSFQLRKGVKFHNGEPFTAEDVKFTMEYALNPKVAFSYADAVRVKEVEIVDDHYVKFYLSKPNCIMLENLAFRLPILPKDYFEKVGAQGFEKHPIGTGRFKWVETA